jgi:N-formylglutamate amidohydrolase
MESVTQLLTLVYLVPNLGTCMFYPQEKEEKEEALVLIMKDEYPHSLFDRVKKKIQYY